MGTVSRSTSVVKEADLASAAYDAACAESRRAFRHSTSFRSSSIDSAMTAQSLICRPIDHAAIDRTCGSLRPCGARGTARVRRISDPPRQRYGWPGHRLGLTARLIKTNRASSCCSIGRTTCGRRIRRMQTSVDDRPYRGPFLAASSNFGD